MQGENKEIKCIACNKLIAKGILLEGSISIKCKCGTINTLKKEAKENKTSGIVLGDFAIQRIST